MGNSRVDELVQHWSRHAKFHGGKEANGFRRKSRSAATSVRSIVKILSGYDMSHTTWKSDIEVLQAAAKLLDKFGDDFEVAQRKCDKILSEEEKRRQAEKEKQRREAAALLFGHPADSDKVLGLARDILDFWGQVNEWAKTHRRTQAGLFHIDENYRIGSALREGRVDLLITLLADEFLLMDKRGGPYQDRWHAGWDDFQAWRSNREQK